MPPENNDENMSPEELRNLKTQYNRAKDILEKISSGHGTKNMFSDRVTKSWLGQWIVWPSYHLEHHRQGTGNYEFFFTWWDKGMRTQVRRHE